MASFDEFVKAFEGRVKTLLLMGKTATKIKEVAEKEGFTNSIILKDMEACVREAYRTSSARGCCAAFACMRQLGYVYEF